MICLLDLHTNATCPATQFHFCSFSVVLCTLPPDMVSAFSILCLCVQRHLKSFALQSLNVSYALAFAHSCSLRLHACVLQLAAMSRPWQFGLCGTMYLLSYIPTPITLQTHLQVQHQTYTPSLEQVFCDLH